MKRPILFLAVIGVVLFLVGVSGVAFVVIQRQSPSSEKTTTQRFIVPPGQAVARIAERLEVEGLIRNPWIFRFELKRLGLEKQIQAGTFELSASMSMQEVAEALTRGTNDVWITIPEGWRREEIAEYLSQQDLSAFDDEAFLDKTATLEGKLFPETYLIPRQITAEGLIALLTKTFTSKVTVGLAQEITSSQKSLTDIMIMASLVEREARTYPQMRLVAGILWNRVKIGMPLQVDATLQYAKGYDKTQDTWWSTPLAVDRTRVSVFNTYLNPGLPPHPIANPGLDAIRATLSPLQTTDLFYIHAPDGQMYSAPTLAEHTRNIQRYLR